MTDLNISYIHRNNPQLKHQQFIAWFQNINKTVDEVNIKKGASSNSSCLRAGIKTRLEAETVTQTTAVSLGVLPRLRSCVHLAAFDFPKNIHWPPEMWSMNVPFHIAANQTGSTKQGDSIQWFSGRQRSAAQLIFTAEAVSAIGCCCAGAPAPGWFGRALPLV